MKTIFTFTTLVLIGSLCQSQTTVNIEPPIDDAFVYEFTPTINYGASNNLDVGLGPSGDLRTFIKWDLGVLPSCISVGSADIRLEKWNSGIVCVNTYAIDGTWSENTVNWNNQPFYSTWFNNQCFNNPGTYLIPADGLLNFWRTVGNEGVVLELLSGTTWASFESKEAGGADPRLIVTYTLAPPPSGSASTTNECNGQCDGSASISATSGTPPYTYDPWQSNNSLCAGIYYVTVTDDNACTDEVFVQIGSSPNPSANAGADVTICVGNSDQLSATGGVSCSWSPTAGLSNPNICNPVANPSSTTTYTVTVTDINSCTATDQVVVTVDPNTTLAVIPTFSSDNGSCNGSATANPSGGVPGYSYVWAGLSCPCSNTNTIAGLCSGTYSVTVTDNIGCSVIDNVFVPLIPIGIENNVVSISNLKVFPNPSKNEFMLEMELAKPLDVEITLLNTLGQVIYSKKLTKYSGKYKRIINTQNLRPGVYLLGVQTKEGTIRKRVLIV